MYSIAVLGHAVESVNIVEQAVSYLLSYVWSFSDLFMRPLIDDQIHAHYLLADNLLHRIKNIDTFDYQWLHDQESEDIINSTSGVQDGGVNDSGDDDTSKVDPRCLGYDADVEIVGEPTCIKQMKRLVVRYIERGLSFALAVKDSIAIQNGITFFWNLHVPLFR